MANGYIVGIDEAGRGPLAGPVALGAFGVKSRATLKKFSKVKDSKQLTEKQREEWFDIIKKHAKLGGVFWSVSFANSATIDRDGLTKVIYTSVNRCLKKLEKQDVKFANPKILLDGLLHAGNRYTDQKTIIGGDESESIIALASICAKVCRDRKMKRLGREYPQYGFEIHKGYGTEAHYEAIEKHGITPVHRKRFLGKILL